MTSPAPAPAATAADNDTSIHQYHAQLANSTAVQQPQASIEYVLRMRRLFSPPGSVNSDGSINQVGQQPPAPDEPPAGSNTWQWHLCTAFSICMGDQLNLQKWCPFLVQQLHQFGSLQEFFRPKKVLTLMDRKWSDAEQRQLYRGLEQFGVGRWSEIQEQLLPVRKCCVVIATLAGCQLDCIPL